MEVWICSLDCRRCGRLELGSREDEAGRWEMFIRGGNLAGEASEKEFEWDEAGS